MHCHSGLFFLEADSGVSYTVGHPQTAELALCGTHSPMIRAPASGTWIIKAGVHFDVT